MNVHTNGFKNHNYTKPMDNKNSFQHSGTSVSAGRNRISAGRNHISAGRNHISAGRNHISAGRNPVFSKKSKLLNFFCKYLVEIRGDVDKTRFYL